MDYSLPGEEGSAGPAALDRKACHPEESAENARRQELLGWIEENTRRTPAAQPGPGPAPSAANTRFARKTLLEAELRRQKALGELREENGRLRERVRLLERETQRLALDATVAAQALAHFTGRFAEELSSRRHAEGQRDLLRQEAQDLEARVNDLSGLGTVPAAPPQPSAPIPTPPR